jgi:hypothetical protein
MTESDPPSIDGFEAALNNVASSIHTERLERHRSNRLVAAAIGMGLVLLLAIGGQSYINDRQNDENSREAVAQRAQTLKAARNAESAARDTAELVEFVERLTDPARSAANAQRTEDLLALLLRCSDVDTLRGSAEREACFRSAVAELRTTTTTAPVP